MRLGYGTEERGALFTGLVEARATVRSTEARGRGMRLVVAAPGPWWEARVGDSISVSGVCLSVAELSDSGVGEAGGQGSEGSRMGFDLSAETLARTWLARLRPGMAVNLERAMRLDARVDGHLVAGHVDGQGRIESIEDSGDGGRRFAFEVESGMERWLVEKGSVAIDGVSLTVVKPRGRIFSAAVVPITLEKTTLGIAQAGQSVNVEADLIGKWVERLVRGGEGSPCP